MFVLGLNAYHADASACLLENGRLVAAVEEERFRRIKHWAGFPSESIRYCLQEAGIRLHDVQHVALNSDSKVNRWAKLSYAVRQRPTWRLVLEKVQTRKRRSSIRESLKKIDAGRSYSGQIHPVEHHLAHLASGFYCSPFEQAVCVSVDGFGDFSSGVVGFGIGKKITTNQRILFPHSLGVFYQAMTQFLGFNNYGDEYKVMGLASYGTPSYVGELNKLVGLDDTGQYHLDLSYFRHYKHEIGYEWIDSEPRVSALYNGKLESILGPAREGGSQITQLHKDVAASTQCVYEKALLHLLNTAHSKTPSENIALAGGCAMNSVANGKIKTSTPFKKVYVQPAAGDAGGALGAALVVSADIENADDSNEMNHAYWGPSFSNAVIENVMEQHEDELQIAACEYEKIEDETQLLATTATKIEQGKVIGWFQGRMEWGPRALGNRSILCDPRRSDLQQILNEKIKRRESFRPFAPSILREQVPNWFETDDDVPFMMKVYNIRQEKRRLIPAVTHVDGTGRLQTVTRQSNQRFFDLISCFHRLTSVPMLLNTSFNENEPIVCRPEEALQCFLRTKMDVLVMQDYYIERHGS